jgi:adenine-specific DNA-methyltransferase
MANLSQQKRQRMLEFLNKIRNEHSDDSSLIAINEIETELTSKKYGLIWEEHEERVDLEMQTKVPIFTEIKNREITAIDKNCYNFLLEGDNLHSLKLLEKTHKEKIDVIYIDPPYNTGGKDFVYDDRYIDGTDGFRHSKWLSFMNERLKIANRLLTNKGVLFISIDDNELYPLKMLCDDLFGENNFVTNIIWQKKTGASDAKGIATITEYILVYMKDINKAEDVFDKNYEAFDIKRYRFIDEYENERGPYYFDSLDRGSVRYSDSLNYGIKAPDGKLIFPNGRSTFENDGWTWKWSKDKVEWGIKNGFIDISPSGKKGNGWAVRYKIYLNVDNEGNPVEKSAPYKNMITSVLNADAAADIKNMFGGLTVFKYSKPVKLIKILLSLIKDKNVSVLDFFAGSGTTAQAVLEQNKLDEGKRHFILCTNNESNICEDITYKRIEKTIRGYKIKNSKIVEGISANLKYYKTDFIPKVIEDPEYSITDELMKHIKEMVQLELGISISDEYPLILTDEDADNLENDLDKLSKCKCLYISNGVLLTSSQEKLFKAFIIKTIPDYYFRNELQEVGEL